MKNFELLGGPHIYPSVRFRYSLSLIFVLSLCHVKEGFSSLIEYAQKSVILARSTKNSSFSSEFKY